MDVHIGNKLITNKHFQQIYKIIIDIYIVYKNNKSKSAKEIEL